MATSFSTFIDVSCTTSACKDLHNSSGSSAHYFTGNRTGAYFWDGAFLFSSDVFASQKPLLHSKSQLSLPISSQTGAPPEEEQEEVGKMHVCRKQAAGADLKAASIPKR